MPSTNRFVAIVRDSLKFAMTVALFFVFGYFQLIYQCGWVVAAAIALYLAWFQFWLLPLLLGVCNCAASYYGVRPAMLVSFLVLDFLLMLPRRKSIDDTMVKMRPHEAEVRAFLFNTSPSMLHRVDGMLDEYKGREGSLLIKLQDEFTPKKDKVPGSSRKARTSTAGRSSSAREYAPGCEPEELEDSDFSCLYLASRTNTPAKTATTGESGKSSSHSLHGRGVGGARAGGGGDDVEFARVQICAVLERHDPRLLPSVDRMLRDYVGREMELVTEIEAEYQSGNGTGGGGDAGGFGGGSLGSNRKHATDGNQVDGEYHPHHFNQSSHQQQGGFLGFRSPFSGGYSAAAFKTSGSGDHGDGYGAILNSMQLSAGRGEIHNEAREFETGGDNGTYGYSGQKGSGSDDSSGGWGWSWGRGHGHSTTNDEHEELDDGSARRGGGGGASREGYGGHSRASFGSTSSIGEYDHSMQYGSWPAADHDSIARAAIRVEGAGMRQVASREDDSYLNNERESDGGGVGGRPTPPRLNKRRPNSGAGAGAAAGLSVVEQAKLEKRLAMQQRIDSKYGGTHRR